MDEDVARVTLLVFLIVILLWAVSIGYTNEQVLKVKVTDKERVTGEGSKYLIFTNKGVFEITDQLFFGKFNSSDIYGSIKKDSTYIIKVHGKRIPLFSMYPNIRSVKKISNNGSNSKQKTSIKGKGNRI